MTVVAADAPASAIPWGPTVTELGYFSLITVGSVVLFGAIFGVLAVLGLALGSAFGGL
jgi:hypothetical protein